MAVTLLIGEIEHFWHRFWASDTATAIATATAAAATATASATATATATATCGFCLFGAALQYFLLSMGKNHNNKNSKSLELAAAH